MSASKVDDIRGVRTELVFWPPHARAHVHALRKKMHIEKQYSAGGLGSLGKKPCLICDL